EPCQPKRAQDVVLTAERLWSKRLQGTPQGGHPRLVSCGEPRGRAIQEQINRPPWRRARRRSTGSLGHLPHSASAAEPAGEDRRSQRFEVRLPREPRLERFEPFGPIEQQ